MFSYYGSKSKLVHLYPRPQHGRIIEPFAGSARYSLRYFENEILLCDISPFVYEVWKYLIQALEKDILSLPDIPSKVHIDNYTQLIDVEKWLIGFCLCRGKAKPRKVGHGQNSWARDKVRIAADLYKIRHWKICNDSYLSLREDRAATWFIDAPYQKINTKANGDRYLYSNIDYERLRGFVDNRNGLVIVCEGKGADWLPFSHLINTNGNTNSFGVKEQTELIYTQHQEL